MAQIKRERKQIWISIQSTDSFLNKSQNKSEDIPLTNTSQKNHKS